MSVREDTPRMPPDLDEAAHKGTAGRLLCLVGSSSYPGAAQLVAHGAMRAGAGLVTIGVFHPEIVPSIAAAVPEVVYLDLSRTRDLYVGQMPREIAAHDNDVRLVGPGLGHGGSTRELVRALLRDEYQGPLVVDADGLNAVANNPELLRGHPGPVVITPHPGEAARLLGRPIPAEDEGRGEAATAMAELTGALCVLKGRGTIVSDGTRTWTCCGGNPGMASAGSGDVLAGVLGAYLAACGEGFDAFDAACAAVHVHARAGDLAAALRGRRALIARDLIEHLPAAQLEAGAR